MPEYSEQDLKHAARFREEIHREALAIVQRTRPDVTQVVDRHPAEDYFQQNWDYPGRWYTVVAVPPGFKSREALVDTIVRDTLSAAAAEETLPNSRGSNGTAAPDPARRMQPERLGVKPDDDPFYILISEYPDLAVDYCLVEGAQRGGCELHRAALRTAFGRSGFDYDGDPDRAEGKCISPGELFSSDDRGSKLHYRKAFLCPPHPTGYTDRDFARVNAALFPNGTDSLEVYEWSTDWSDYFDDGREWWGTLCLTVYDGSLDRFAVITASATD